jgi:DNA-binding response OmpR family regulator
MNGSETILVAEDQAAMLETIQVALEMSGYRVLTACDGLEALAILESEPVDLILADIAMPRLNGYQLYERVRENPQWVAIPFVFVTARAMDSDIHYALEMGVDDYLTKPIQLDHLLSTVRGKLRRARQLSQQYDLPSEPAAPEAEILEVGPLRMEPDEYRAWMHGEPVQLSLTEFTLLEYLIRRAGRAVALTELCQVTHNLDTDHGEAGSLLYPLVRTLRRKLGYPTGEMGCIENVRGVGYRLVVPQDP